MERSDVQAETVHLAGMWDADSPSRPAERYASEMRTNGCTGMTQQSAFGRLATRVLTSAEGKRSAVIYRNSAQRSRQVLWYRRGSKHEVRLGHRSRGVLGETMEVRLVAAYSKHRSPPGDIGPHIGPKPTSWSPTGKGRSTAFDCHSCGLTGQHPG